MFQWQLSLLLDKRALLKLLKIKNTFNYIYGKRMLFVSHRKSAVTSNVGKYIIWDIQKNSHSESSLITWFNN